MREPMSRYQPERSSLRRRPCRAGRILALIAMVAGLSVIAPLAASAGFLPPPASAALPLATGTLAAPTAVSSSCSGSPAAITISWTRTTSAFATGYSVLRSTTSGGGYSQVGTVSGLTTTSYVDHPGGLLNLNFFYVVEATYHSWTSANSNQTSVTLIDLLGILVC